MLSLSHTCIHTHTCTHTHIMHTHVSIHTVLTVTALTHLKPCHVSIECILWLIGVVFLLPGTAGGWLVRHLAVGLALLLVILKVPDTIKPLLQLQYPAPSNVCYSTWHHQTSATVPDTIKRLLQYLTPSNVCYSTRHHQTSATVPDTI